MVKSLNMNKITYRPTLSHSKLLSRKKTYPPIDLLTNFSIAQLLLEFLIRL